MNREEHLVRWIEAGEACMKLAVLAGKPKNQTVDLYLRALKEELAAMKKAV